MPTPDASQFTQFKKYSAIAQRRDDGQSQQKTITHLYQPVPSVTQPTDFLASFTNKYVSTPSFVPINRVTGPQHKPKVPGGNIHGNTPGEVVIRTWTFQPFTLGETVPSLPLGGPFGKLIVKLTGLVGVDDTTVTITFNTSSLVGFNLASVATYSPILGTKIDGVTFGADTITIAVNPSTTADELLTATINISSNNFNFPITTIAAGV
jgi:hypothetical protein